MTTSSIDDATETLKKIGESASNTDSLDRARAGSLMVGEGIAIMHEALGQYPIY
jgi:hypothetical protein